MFARIYGHARGPYTIERRRAEPPPALYFVCDTRGTLLTPRLATQLFSLVSF